MEISLDFYWPKSLTKEDKFYARASSYFKKNPDLPTVEYLEYILKQLKGKDFIIFQFGKNKWDYLQFCRCGNNLVLDFPWSSRMGRRATYRDTIELMLISRGFHRKRYWFIKAEEDYSKFYHDQIIDDHFLYMDISFGPKREREAALVTLEIALNIFHADPSSVIRMKYGY